MNNKPKILLFSPVRKDVNVLKITIPTWLNLDTKDFNIHYLFFDDNDSVESSEYLNSLEQKNVEIVHFETKIKDNYEGDHNWNLQQIDKISEIKNFALQKTVKEDYDYVFLVDADLALNPNTLTSLYKAKKDFIFEIFWTDFDKNGFYRPNCWDFHSWNYKEPESILKLKKEGVFKVGAGGACTLVSNSIIKKGLNFSRIPNLNYNGEDRHISTRVYALNSDIFIDTHFPAYHIHDLNNIPESKKWIKNNYKRDLFLEWLDDDWKKIVLSSFFKPKTKIEKYKLAFYKARRMFINTIKNE